MIQCASSLGLLLKPPQPIRILCKRDRKTFDRHIPIQLLIARAINLTHSARANLRADFVAGQVFCL